MFSQKTDEKHDYTFAPIDGLKFAVWSQIILETSSFLKSSVVKASVPNVKCQLIMN